MNAKKKGIDQKISNGFFPSYWSHFEHKLNLFWVMYNYVPERHLAPGWNSWPRVLQQKYQSETETACRAQLAMPCLQVYCPCSSVHPLFLTKPGVTTHIHPETKTTHYYHHHHYHHHHHYGNNNKFMNYTYDIACFFLSGTQKIKLCKFCHKQTPIRIRPKKRRHKKLWDFCIHTRYTFP